LRQVFPQFFYRDFDIEYSRRGLIYDEAYAQDLLELQDEVR
jgi:hypothetical protein